MTVERHATRPGHGPVVSVLNLRQSGGTVGDMKFIASNAIFRRVGDRWALALLYGGSNWTASYPAVVQAYPMNPNAALPSVASLNAALAEYCEG